MYTHSCTVVLRLYSLLRSRVIKKKKKKKIASVCANVVCFYVRSVSHLLLIV